MNVHFVKYDRSTGRVLWAGFTQSEAIAGADDVILLDSAVQPESVRVVAGEVVPLPPKPSGFVKFDYAAGNWVPDEAAADTAARSQRNELLVQSDWTQLPDVPLDTKSAWAAYRQDLRDITSQPGYPFDIVWPIPPQ